MREREAMASQGKSERPPFHRAHPRRGSSEHDVQDASINAGYGALAALFGTEFAETIGNALKDLNKPSVPGHSIDAIKSLADEKLALFVWGLQNIFRLPSQEALEPVIELRTRYVLASLWLAKFFKMTGAKKLLRTNTTLKSSLL
jgi:hypothetical protein